MSEAFELPVDVRFRDLDAMGHVNNAVFFTYFEEGRKVFFFRISESTDLSAFPFILARVSCDYLKPVKLHNRLSLEMRVKEMGNKSFTLAYALRDRDDPSVLYARGESVQVCFDYAGNVSMPIPEDLKGKLAAYGSVAQG